jgi:hypothetical protein
MDDRNGGHQKQVFLRPSPIARCGASDPALRCAAGSAWIAFRRGPGAWAAAAFCIYLLSTQYNDIIAAGCGKDAWRMKGWE